MLADLVDRNVLLAHKGKAAAHAQQLQANYLEFLAHHRGVTHLPIDVAFFQDVGHRLVTHADKVLGLHREVDRVVWVGADACHASHLELAAALKLRRKLVFLTFKPGVRRWERLARHELFDRHALGHFRCGSHDHRGQNGREKGEEGVAFQGFVQHLFHLGKSEVTSCCVI